MLVKLKEKLASTCLSVAVSACLSVSLVYSASISNEYILITVLEEKGASKNSSQSQAQASMLLDGYMKKKKGLLAWVGKGRSKFEYFLPRKNSFGKY